MYKSEDRLAEWRNKFASKTMMYLDKYFRNVDLDAEERALHAMWLLGTDDKTCPYYYRVYEEGETPAVSAHKCCLPALTLIFPGNIPVRNCFRCPCHSHHHDFWCPT